MDLLYCMADLQDPENVFCIFSNAKGEKNQERRNGESIGSRNMVSKRSLFLLDQERLKGEIRGNAKAIKICFSSTMVLSWPKSQE